MPLCPGGEATWCGFQKYTFDLCLVDIVIPRRNGIDQARLIRGKNELVPILFVTSRGADEDRIKWFKHGGGDDYITKPFSIQELLLRIEVFLKRTRGPGSKKARIFEFADYQFNYDELTLLKD